MTLKKNAAPPVGKAATRPEKPVPRALHANSAGVKNGGARPIAMTTGSEREMLQAMEALRALDAGKLPSEVELPPGMIINPTRQQIDAQCRLLSIHPPSSQEISKGWCSPVFMMASKSEDLCTMLGGPVVLLEVRPRTKKPVRDKWQKLTIEDMTPQYLAGLNSGCNIGISLGTASRNLITIDLDSEDRWNQLLALNPSFSDTLLTHGNRGGNIWLYVEGDLPASCDIKDRDGNRSLSFAQPDGKQ
jgi:hypothetical protein